MTASVFHSAPEQSIKNNGKKRAIIDFLPLERNTDDLQEVLRTLIHEIRNPLTNIGLSLELLEAADITPDLKELTGIIRHSTSRINELTKSIFYEEDARKERHNHSINLLLDETLKMAQDRIILKKINVEKSYDCDLCEVRIDESEMSIAFLNIIINAIEAMPEANGVLKISTSSNGRRKTVMIEDNGQGINPADMEKLFEPFFTTKPSGLGFGLSSTLRILQAHQATVKVESEKDKGTRFIVSF